MILAVCIIHKNFFEDPLHKGHLLIRRLPCRHDSECLVIGNDSGSNTATRESPERRFANEVVRIRAARRSSRSDQWESRRARDRRDWPILCRETGATGPLFAERQARLAHSLPRDRRDWPILCRETGATGHSLPRDRRDWPILCRETGATGPFFAERQARLAHSLPRDRRDWPILCRETGATGPFFAAHPELLRRAGAGGVGREVGNGELGTGNGERGTGNGEWGTGMGTGNGERGTKNGERGTENGNRKTQDRGETGDAKPQCWPLVRNLF